MQKVNIPTYCILKICLKLHNDLVIWCICLYKTIAMGYNQQLATFFYRAIGIKISSVCIYFFRKYIATAIIHRKKYKSQDFAKSDRVSCNTLLTHIFRKKRQNAELVTEKPGKLSSNKNIKY